MNESGELHEIEGDLADGWLEAWIDEGVGALEDYLAKHLAFLSFLDEASAA